MSRRSLCKELLDERFLYLRIRFPKKLGTKFKRIRKRLQISTKMLTECDNSVTGTIVVEMFGSVMKKMPKNCSIF